MNRRKFLSLAGAGFGGAFIPRSGAERILQASSVGGLQTPLAPLRADVELWALIDVGIEFHFGSPYVKPLVPTLGQCISERGYDPHDPADLLKYLVAEWCLDPARDDLADAMLQIQGTLGLPLDETDGPEWGRWEHAVYDTTASSRARAFHYLCGFPLGTDHDPAGESLGRIRFMEGDRPGSNLTYVDADGLQAVHSLQYRLNQLGANTRIRIEVADWAKMEWEWPS